MIEKTGEPAPLRVGVIDSGWDRTVADMRVEKGVALVNDEVDEFALGWSTDSHDRLGHGTGCADVILQVAPRARIVPIRVFGKQLETSPKMLIAALNWAVDNQLPLVNLSLGTDRADALQAVYAACERARRAGTVVVAAAGRRVGETFPAIFEPVIGVASTRTAERFDIVYRPESALECEARGSQLARGLGGVQQTFVGSSFATPVVTGHVANFLVHAPGSSLQDVRQMLAELSERVRSDRARVV